MAEENNQVHLPTPEQGYDRHEPRAGLVALVSGITVAVLVVFIVGTYWLYQVSYEAIDQQQYSGVASKELLAIREREDAHLYRYAVIDKTKGTVRIPIDRAIELVASDYAQGKVFYNTATYAVKPEPPGGAAAPAQAPAPPQDANVQTAPAK
ncbi:MAG: hypothetical protein C0504_04655 [Candidatus Solibacter sp.]|nr:hypothetical protein [Candidatus Solibacter sp.]